MIYVLVNSASPLIDIGYSADPARLLKRYRSHRTRNPHVHFYCAIEGKQLDEQAIHAHFKADLLVADDVGCETFHASPELVRYVEWLGCQPWAACSLDEVGDPLAHWAPDIPWHPWNYTDNGARDRFAWSLFDGPGLLGAVRAPLPASQRDVEWLRDENDYYTPTEYVESARRAMGGIDLDPASSQWANRRIRAGRIYTKNDDGLAPSNKWSGKVWLNPPYGRLAGPFMDRLRAEYTAGNVEQAVACLNSSGNTTHWFQPLWSLHICWPVGRVKFWGGSNPDDVKTDVNNAPMNGTCFVYFGSNTEAFIREFDQYGPITPGAVNRRIEVAA
jgi:hypothetical protein